MRKLGFILALLFAGFVNSNVQAQTYTYTFECFCGYLTPQDTTCDICGPTIQSRFFSGMLIRRNGLVWKWIEEPYTVKFLAGVATIQELLPPNPETVKINILSTTYDTLPDYKAALTCPCGGTVVQDTVVVVGGEGITVLDSFPRYIVINTGDLDSLNEIQTYAHTGTTSYTNTLSLGGGAFTLQAAGIVGISHNGSGTVTITAAEVDGSVTNELQTFANTSNATSHTLTLSNSGGSAQLVEGSGITLTTTGTTLDGIVTIAAVDASTTNELQTYGHSGTTSYTNTLSLSGGSFTLQAAGIASISHTAGTVTITATEVDGSVTNEAQTLSVSGTTSGILTLSTAGGAGGGAATIAAGSGIAVSQSGGTITITNSSPATAGWLLDGNTITTARRIGSNDNFDVVVETNGLDRLWFDNAGTMSLGATQLTTAQFNINTLGSTNIGMLISGGGSLVGPTFFSATGSGSGSTATVFSGVVSMISGNVEARIENTAASGTGSSIVHIVSDAGASGDAVTHYEIDAVTTWKTGIDNSASDAFRLQPLTTLGSSATGVSILTSGFTGVNTLTPLVELQVTGTGGIGFPQGTTAQRPSSPTFPVLRWNSTFSGFETWDPNKNYWYRLTAVSSPSVASNTAAGTGHSAGLVSGAGSNDVRGAVELNTGSASLTTGTVLTVTYAAAYSGTATNVLLTARNDPATTEHAKWRIGSQTQTGFTVRAVSALTANTTYQFNYYVGQ